MFLKRLVFRGISVSQTNLVYCIYLFIFFFFFRNTCLLCSRAYSQNENVTTIKDEAQDVEQTDVPVIEPPLEWKTLSGVPPFWIRTPVPMWKAAYAKLQIPTPKADAPTVNYGGIEVPKKVKRDSVTILKALSETQQFVSS